MKLKKSGEKFLNVLMGRPLVVSVYHIITDDPAFPLTELDALKSCPSQFIMDNKFYYGEYEIVGNSPLPDNIDYPIMYGRSIDSRADKIVYQRGRICRELPLGENRLIGSHNYLHNGIGWSLNLNKTILEECIRENSNAPYWENDKGGFSRDIRNPLYADDLAAVLEQMEGGILPKLYSL